MAVLGRPSLLGARVRAGAQRPGHSFDVCAWRHREVGRVDRWTPLPEVVVAAIRIDEKIPGTREARVAIKTRYGLPGE